MAKSTKAQQASTGTSDSYTEAELADPTPPIQITRAMLGAVPEREVSPSVGMDSSPSSESEITRNDNGNPSHLPLAPMMGNPFGAPEKVMGSTVVSTAGAGLGETEPPPFDEELEGFDDEYPEEEEEAPEPVKKSTPARKTAAKKARARTIGDDDFSLLD